MNLRQTFNDLHDKHGAAKAKADYLKAIMDCVPRETAPIMPNGKRKISVQAAVRAYRCQQKLETIRLKMRAEFIQAVTHEQRDNC